MRQQQHGRQCPSERSNAVVEPRETAERPQDENDPPQAMLIFVIGDHRVSDSFVLGVLNEHPEALKGITSNRCLSTSAFLRPALQVAIEMAQKYKERLHLEVKLYSSATITNIICLETHTILSSLPIVNP